MARPAWVRPDKVFEAEKTGVEGVSKNDELDHLTAA